MCLSTVSPRKYKHKRVGYKVFKTTKKEHKFCTPIKNTSRGYIVGSEYEDRKLIDVKIRPIHGDSYSCGYHIFLRKSDAFHYLENDTDKVVMKVRFSKVVANGQHKTWKPMGCFSSGSHTGPCVVARKMKLVKVVKRNEK